MAPKTCPEPQERVSSSSEGQRQPPAFACRHQQGWLTPWPRSPPTRFLRSPQVSEARGGQNRKSAARNSRGAGTLSFSPLLGHSPNRQSRPDAGLRLSPFLSETHLPFPPAPTRFAHFPPRPTSPLQDNLSSDGISFILVISFYGPASPSRCKTRNVRSKQPALVCIPYASVCGYQF